jgi:cobalamin biosynthesis Mg chelatase CobN
LPYARRTLVLSALAAMAVLAFGAGPALSANCGRQIIDDWFKDGRVDKVYALHCYDDALEQLPNDVRTYSDAPQAIKRALQQALAKGAPVDTSPTDTTPAETTPTETTPEDPTTTDPAETTSTDTTPTSTTGTDGPSDPGGSGNEAIDDSSSASSVPIPLLVLAGLALLLLAAGGAGYLNRRMQARRVDGGPDDPAPPSDL